MLLVSPGWRLTAVVLVVAGCELAVAPRSATRLDEIRRVAPSGYGTFNGVVRGLSATDSIYCGRSSPVLAGVRVDLGVWHASPSVYRDTLTGMPPSTLEEPLFEIVASTISDSVGRFVFESLPRRMGFAFRAFPPPDGSYRLTYGYSL